MATGIYHLNESDFVFVFRLVRQFVAFSPGGNFRPTVIQPASSIREEANATLEGSALAIEFDLAESLWSVSVDPAQFRNVIKQMVQNAMEATPTESGGKLWIIATNEPANHEKPPTLAPGDYVKISIRDQGCGISSENLPRIFDPYFPPRRVVPRRVWAWGWPCAMRLSGDTAG